MRFTYHHENNCDIFINDFTGKKTIFCSNGTVIGPEGNTMDHYPNYFLDCFVPFILNNTLTRMKKFATIFYPDYGNTALSSYIDEWVDSEKCVDKDTVKYAGVAERLFKVMLQYAHKKQETFYGRGFQLEDIASTANRLAKMVAFDKLYEESDLIEFCQTRYCSGHQSSYSLVQSLTHWLNLRAFWKTVPTPYEELPPVVQNVCNIIISDPCFPLSEKEKVALRNAARNGLILNLSYLYSPIDPENGVDMAIGCSITQYFELCRALHETPNLNGNFITKFAELTRKKESMQHELFAYHQNKRCLAFSNGEFAVIVPQNVDALIQEGKNQHNCVGTWNYDQKVADGECNIVFVRKVDNPDASYITCEIDENGEIQQYLSSRNEEVEDKDALKFCSEYQDYLSSIWWC